MEIQRLRIPIKADPANPAYCVVIIPGNGQNFLQKPNEITNFSLRVKSHFEKASIDVGVVDGGLWL